MTITVEAVKEKFKVVAEKVRMTVRAAQGLPIDDDAYQGLINPDDIRERTRVNASEMIGRTYMRSLAEKYPHEMEMWGKIVEHLDHYAISLNEGEGRREAILMQRSRSEIIVPGQPMQLPSVQTQQQLSEQPQKQEAKKK